MQKRIVKKLEELKIEDFDLKTYTVSKRKKCDLPYEKESDAIITFDIETTSAFLTEEGEVIGYIKGMKNDYWNSLTPLALPYHCQIYFEGTVFTFRRIQQLEDFMKQLPKDTHFIIWVHNLPFEFHFIKDMLAPWEDVFARQPHKPIKAVSEKYPNIEFRCTYSLTRLSLAEWGKDLGCEKMEGDLDYNILRTPLTKMTEKEIGYCVRDVEVVAKGIERELATYGHIERIPLTQTGKVRRELKRRVLADDTAYKMIKKLVPKDAYMYSIMKQCFSGGYTHANFLWSGEVQGAGNQYDFASSYPYVMCSEKFPMTPFIEDEFDEEEFDSTAYMVKISFEKIAATTANHFISYSKTEEIKKEVVDNGRVIKADKLTMWMTEQDFLVIKECYEWKKMEVLECYSSEKRYLPKVFIDFLLELYGNKTSYKDVEGKEEIYRVAKSFINSVFGMSVTDLIMDEVLFFGDSWSIKYQTTAEVEEQLAKLKKDTTGKYFIAYQWGPWITAYARKNLWDCLLTVDRDALYCDTDSIKMIGDADFSWYNKRADEKLKKMCEVYKIDFSLTRPKTPKGKEKPLGYFAKEEPFSEFITMGAKKYCYREEETGILKLTISGINKGAVKCLNDKIENFAKDFNFDKDSEYVTKKSIFYCEHMPKATFKKGEYDEWELDTTCGIVLRPCGYKLGMSSDYENLLENVFAVFEEGDDEIETLACL